MVQRLKQKLKTKGNKGFTLVELIVVIVILAILIGATIGGVFSYVNKSRINTDINNASAIQSACSSVCTDIGLVEENVTYYLFWSKAIDTKEGMDANTWKEFMTSNQGALGFFARDNETKDIYGDEEDDWDWKNSDVALQKICSLLTEGLPEPKAGGFFVLEICPKGDGIHTTVSCKAYKGDAEIAMASVYYGGDILGTPLDAQE